jgi:hypothetical protein
VAAVAVVAAVGDDAVAASTDSCGQMVESNRKVNREV